MMLTLNIIMYVLRVSGTIQVNGLHPPLHLGVVAIEKEAFGSPSTTVSQFTTHTQYIPPTGCKTLVQRRVI